MAGVPFGAGLVNQDYVDKTGIRDPDCWPTNGRSRYPNTKLTA
jgi:hypothetical protein